MRFLTSALGIAIIASLAMPAGALTIDVQTTVANVGPVTSCPANVNFNAKIIATGWPTSSNHSLQYTWLRSDNSTGPTLTLNFPNGVDTQTVSTYWQLPKNSTGWYALQITYPSPLTSNRATFTLSCPIVGSIEPGNGGPVSGVGSNTNGSGGASAGGANGPTNSAPTLNSGGGQSLSGGSAGTRP